MSRRGGDITERKEAEEEIRRLNKELGHRIARRTTQLKEANIELQDATEANLTERRGAERALSDKNFELQNAEILINDYHLHKSQFSGAILQSILTTAAFQVVPDLLQTRRSRRPPPDPNTSKDCPKYG